MYIDMPILFGMDLELIFQSIFLYKSNYLNMWELWNDIINKIYDSDLVCLMWVFYSITR